MCQFRTRLVLLSLALSVTLGSNVSMADDVLLQIDNDKVVDTDRHYTNGMRFAYTPTPPPSQKPTQLETTGSTLARLSQFADKNALRTGWALGQEMYTPEDVDVYVPNPNDRPYAGWTYLGITVQNDSKLGAESGADLQETFELDLGMIGPSSKAAQLQNAFHRLINVSVSRGWRSQIHDEPGILATRITKVRSKAEHLAGPDWLKYDFISHGSAHLGNVKTAVSAGVTARLGFNLHEDFGPIYGTFAVPQKAPKNNSFALFFGFDARAVARDIFLDGNTFRKSADVKRNPFVAETRLGISTNYHGPITRNKNVHFSIAMVNRTREFATQDKADRYGSLQATVNF